VKKVEERSDKNERRKKKQDKSKGREKVCVSMFPNFHKNVSVASQFTDSNSLACVIIMHSLFSKGYAVAQLVETLRQKVAGSIADCIIGIFH
jgi:hypothetical protein